MLISYAALGATLFVLPGRQSSGPLAVLGLVVAVAVVGLLLRPVLTGLTVVLGSLGLLVVGVLSQAVILGVAVAVAPGLDITGSSEVLLVSWVAAVVAALLNWIFDAGSDDVFLAQLLRRAIRTADGHTVGASDPVPGGRRLLVVQLDGVGLDLLQQAITAGEVPTLDGWLRAGSHVLRGWHVGAPSTTPASQAVLLHGDVTEIPSFRWYEKADGRVVVASHPRDAEEIERRISDGRGLLADGGVSVSNFFSGDATHRFFTLSDGRLPRRTPRGLAPFAITRGGSVHSVVVFVGQVVTELYQGRRQRQRDVRPRVRRGLPFALQRALTTSLLRDATVAIVAEQLALGAPVIFVDLGDYDDVAHRAGPSRPEAMRTLDGLDRVAQLFMDIIRATGQDYDVVILSDHGQAQGATFTQLSGVPLTQVVDALTGPGDGGIVVTAAGNLAHVYLTDQPGRVTREAVDGRHPRLVAGLVRHPHVGAVMVRTTPSADSPTGLVALGADGWRVLTPAGAVGGEGRDPTEAFGPRAAVDLWELDKRQHVGDVVVLGRVDASTGAVTAFEDQVGSHGGLGGSQTSAMLLHPAEWSIPTGEVLTGTDVHDLLLRHRCGKGVQVAG